MVARDVPRPPSPVTVLTSEAQLDVEGEDDLGHQELLTLLQGLEGHKVRYVVPRSGREWEG